MKDKDIKDSIERRKKKPTIKECVETFLEYEYVADLLRCPICGRYNAMEKHPHGFTCIWSDCEGTVSLYEFDKAKLEVISDKTGILVDTLKWLRRI